MAGFSGLTFAVEPVVVNTGSDAAPVWALNTALVAGTTVIAGILDPTMTQRIFNPVAEGNPVVAADAYTKWLPVLNAISAAEVTDNLNGGLVNIGQVTLKLAPAASNFIEASSVMTFKVSPQAIVLTCTAGTF